MICYTDYDFLSKKFPSQLRKVKLVCDDGDLYARIQYKGKQYLVEKCYLYLENKSLFNGPKLVFPEVKVPLQYWS